MEEIKISTEFIKLDQFLKFSSVCYDGAEAKFLIKDGLVSVNGEQELRRGRKLYCGDRVKINLEDETIELTVQ